MNLKTIYNGKFFPNIFNGIDYQVVTSVSENLF